METLTLLPHLRSLLVNLRETKRYENDKVFVFLDLYYYVMDRHMLLSLTI